MSTTATNSVRLGDLFSGLGEGMDTPLADLTVTDITGGISEDNLMISVDSINGRLVIEDPDLREYCQVVWSVTRGPVWSASRIGESNRLITGGYSLLLDNYLSRSGDWLREPGPPALPPPDATIEMLFLPEEPENLPAD